MTDAAPPQDPPLADLLRRRIAVTGPITLADYMADCLLHPQHGYYSRGGVLGAEGDFITAPEISQMFGELVGLALAQSWLDQGAPDSFVLAELGPGRGTLMADILRVCAKVPGFLQAARPHLIEASPALRDTQAATLSRATSPNATAPDITWLNNAADLPEAPLWLVANEFFDALPIRQFQRQPQGWAETMVGLDGPALTLARAPAAPLGALQHRWEDTQPGQIVEHCPTLAPMIQAISGRIARHGGAALIVDYGTWAGTGDTFQAVAGHRSVDPLAAPGRADLTAHVDFAEIARAARDAGLETSAMAEQGAFLRALGIGPRAQILGHALPPGPRRDAHLAAYRRLTMAEEMGSLFKVIGLVPPGAPMLAGLTP